jgi:hypothetical protein
MRTTAAFLAAVTVVTSLARIAAAQEPPDESPPPQVQGTEQPPPEAPPPGYPPPADNAAPAPPALPAAVVGLGAAGQIAVSSDLDVAVARHSQSIMGSTTKSTSIKLWPALDYFAAPNLSIGGQVRIQFDSGGDNDVTTIGLLPRIGYNISMGPALSIWPRAGVGYVHTSSNNSGYSASGYTVTFFAFVPLLFEAAQHFFIGGGPYLETDLVSKVQSRDSYKMTDFGLKATVGGYFGGT